MFLYSELQISDGPHICAMKEDGRVFHYVWCRARPIVLGGPDGHFARTDQRALFLAEDGSWLEGGKPTSALWQFGSESRAKTLLTMSQNRMLVFDYPHPPQIRV